MKKPNNFLLFCLPVVVFFTNFPLIKLGGTEAMNLEISLPEIWLVVFFFTNITNIKALIKFFSLKRLVIISLFPLYATASAIWSPNHLRAILTAGLIWLLIFAILNIIYILKSADKLLREKLIQIFLVTSFVVSIFCWLQCALDLMGVSADGSLMCNGCVYASFGFPHPNGFAIEPQFMGGLEIAPALLSFYLATKNEKRLRYLLLGFFFSATLFLTFSRGAIYAFSAALIFFVVATAIKKHRAKVFLILPIVLAAFFTTLSAQGIMAAVSPTSDDFVSGTTKALHHLTLGKLDLRPKAEEPAQTPTEEMPAVPATAEPSHYSGYVEDSTNIRLNFTDLALRTATENPKNFIFGTGLGSAGTVLREKYPDKVGSKKEIVQNEYASLLLELGLAGIALVAAMIIAGYVSVGYAEHGSASLSAKTPVATAPWDAKGRRPTGVLDAPDICITAIIIGYALTLLFFSGLPNAFHIYLVPPFLFGLIREDLTKPAVRRPGGKQKN